MVQEQDFHRMARRHEDGAEGPYPATAAGLLRRWRERVAEPFARTCGQAVVVETLAPEFWGPEGESRRTGAGEAPDATPLRLQGAAPVFHPLCQPYAASDYCRRMRESHFAEAQRTHDVHWHHCRNGLLCAVVPLVWSGRCLAICNLVCPDHTEQATFECYAELLEVLVDHFLAVEHAALTSLFSSETIEGGRPPPWTVPAAGLEPGAPGPTAHPQVARAIDYIERHLSDPGLTVRMVCDELQMNYTYLVHLFAKHAGMRMSRYIAWLRVELAKRRLASSNGQVKRIALECGYLNADWFSHVFHAITGLTPGDYRAGCRARSPASPSDSEAGSSPTAREKRRGLHARGSKAGPADG